MADPRLEVHDVLGEQSVTVDKLPFTIGRRETNDLRLAGSEVSREHAEIVREGEQFLLKDKGSRYGTFLNGEAVTECRLNSGDTVRLGRGGGADITFFAAGDERSASVRSTTGARDDLRQFMSLLDTFRALGSGRVLPEVLALVLDAAIELSGAERAMIMLAGQAEGGLEMKQARGRNQKPLDDETFKTSQLIPEEVFKTGQTKVVTDLLDSDLADVHMGTVALGIRNVVCVPLNFVQYVESEEAKGEDRRIGVLYLDSREKGKLLSNATRQGLETLAAEASVAIENARLYREKVQSELMQQEIRIAAEIQQALLPNPNVATKFVEASAASIPCRSIGGDFFDYLEESEGKFGFTLGDVAGKGPPAALMSAMMQGMFVSQATDTDGPAAAVTNMNKALCRRGLDSRFVTLMFGIIDVDGNMTYSNAGHNPPLVLGRNGIRTLDVGGPVVGLLDFAAFDQETIKLEPGDTIVVFSDGVSEALDSSGEEFGDERLQKVVEDVRDEPAVAVVDTLISAVRDFTRGAPQSDDITAMVVRYLGPSR